MKSVLISIQPKWCELIANGKKTIEVRKTKPKLDVPFKCYIYCTRQKVIGEILLTYDKEVTGRNKGFRDEGDIPLAGKVIGEFVCDKVYDLKFLPKEYYGQPSGTYEQFICKNSCLPFEDIKAYGNGKNIFGWHISTLVIYDKPKELGEFYQTGINEQNHCYFDYCAGCIYHETPVCEHPCNECDGNRKYLYRPPQSWCYVEELGV